MRQIVSYLDCPYQNNSIQNYYEKRKRVCQDPMDDKSAKKQKKVCHASMAAAASGKVKEGSSISSSRSGRLVTMEVGFISMMLCRS